MQIAVIEIVGHMRNQRISVDMDKTTGICLLDQDLPAVVKSACFTDKVTVCAPKRGDIEYLFAAVDFLYALEIRLACFFQLLNGSEGFIIIGAVGNKNRIGIKTDILKRFRNHEGAADTQIHGFCIEKLGNTVHIAERIPGGLGALCYGIPQKQKTAGVLIGSERGTFIQLQTV